MPLAGLEDTKWGLMLRSLSFYYVFSCHGWKDLNVKALEYLLVLLLDMAPIMRVCEGRFLNLGKRIFVCV